MNAADVGNCGSVGFNSARAEQTIAKWKEANNREPEKKTAMSRVQKSAAIKQSVWPRSPSAAIAHPAKEAHEAWLRSQGIHPDQLKSKRSTTSVSNKPARYAGDGIKTSDTIVDAGRARGIMANLHNEPAHVRNAILEKASRCTTLYNKGAHGLPVASDGNCLGSRSRRL